MKRQVIQIELTPEQSEAVKPLYDALFDKEALGGIGASYGQLDRRGAVAKSFNIAIFSVLDNEGAEKVQRLIREEVQRMALEEASAVTIAEGAN